MASDRGEYTPIPSVLLDGKDFQQLSERANHVFLVLKINMGPTGIEVQYRRSLTFQLSEQSRIPVEGVDAAMDELEDGGWIRTEGNVVWIVEHLRFHPNMNPALVKHRVGVQRYTAGLPRLPIVRAFIEHYPEYFADVDNPTAEFPAEAPDSLSNGIGKPTESRNTQYAVRNTQYASGAAPENGAATKRARKRGTRLSEEWAPTQQHRELAARLGVNAESEEERFRDHAKANGRVAQDWDAAFRNWLRKAPELAGRQKTSASADEKLLRHRQQLEEIDLNASTGVFDE